MKIQKEMIPGQFVARLNRFCALVSLEGQRALAHVPNSGRLKELFRPEAKLFLTKEDRPGRKTPYDLVMVQLGRKLVSCDARLPNHLVYEGLAAHALPEIDDYHDIKREVSFRQGRLDFLLSGGRRPWLVEVKSVTLIQKGVGLFPDAPTLRGTEHVQNLTSALKEGYRAAIIFVIQRSDARSFAPNDGQDPHFGQALRKAEKAGVKVLAYRCRVSLHEVTLDKPLPVGYLV